MTAQHFLLVWFFSASISLRDPHATSLSCPYLSSCDTVAPTAIAGVCVDYQHFVHVWVGDEEIYLIPKRFCTYTTTTKTKTHIVETTHKPTANKSN